MRQSPARHHHNKQRAEGFVPNQNGQDNNNDSGNGPNGNNNNNGNNGSSSSAAATTTTAQTTSAAISRTVAATTTTTTTPPAPTTTTTTTTTPASSSSTTTTSSAVIVTTTTTTPLNVLPTTASVINQIPTTASVPIVYSAANPTIGTASLSSDSASATASAQASSSGPQIGPLVGAIGGGLIGVVALAAIAGYFFRRAFRKKDEFDRSEFVRNSVAINDNWDEKPPMGSQNAMALARGNMDQPSATPRPPSMVERRGQAQPAYGVGEVVNNGYYGQQDQYYNNYGNNGYYGQDQYGAGYDQQYAAGGHPYVAGAAYGYTPPNEYQQSQLTRKPSAPLGAARGPGSEYEQQQQQQQQGHDHVASPAEGSQYDGRHQSVTPFQQQQYNEISKALNGGLTPVNETPAGGRELSTAYSTLNQPQQPAQGQQQHGTPAAANAHQAANNRRSLYDEDDAYGGI
ncbi:hypothetical protein FRC04_008060 [Tulasnella sp. 424]|nr:hypothetical protein FRC04_008060 [Tulasnella sp. 424]